MKSLFTAIFSISAAFIVHAMRRVPSEWEPHAATWMQWPGPYETQMSPDFAKIIKVISLYERVHLLTPNQASETAAKTFLQRRQIPLTNITFHRVRSDNSWMRDNGPIYVLENGTVGLQDWGFDAWGGNFGANIPYENDDAVPNYVGGYLGLRVEDKSDYVLERGNFETNGNGTIVLNWDCQHDRNPTLNKSEHEHIIKQAFGAQTIIWAYGHFEEDKTTGHIDGMCRFSSPNTLVISEYGMTSDANANNLAGQARQAGLNVVWYSSDPNWLVGNGFVAAMASETASENARLKTQLQGLFPGRVVYMVEASAIRNSGGGIHCVTNDQPLIRTS